MKVIDKFKERHTLQRLLAVACDIHGEAMRNYLFYMADRLDWMQLCFERYRLNLSALRLQGFALSQDCHGHNIWAR